MKRIYKVWMACLALACGAGWTGCADSLEDMKKENYEANWIKTFGKVDPNHTWNIAIQAEAELAIKEDALTEYTFKIYDNDPIWGTEAQLLAKATVKTDANGFACTQLKFDAPASLEQYYITRTDSHGRRLLKVSDIENKKINVEFGIYSNDARAGLIEDDNFPVYNLPDYITNLDALLEEAVSLEDGLKDSWGNSTKELKQTGSKVFKVKTDGYTIQGINCDTQGQEYGSYKLIIDANCEWDVTSGQPQQINGLDIIITPGHTLTLIDSNAGTGGGQGNNASCIKLCPFARLYIMEGATLNAFTGNGPINDASIWLEWGSEGQDPLLYNEGTINADYITIKTGNLYNAPTGIININDETEGKTASIGFQQGEIGTLTNYGKIHAEAIIGNGRTESLGTTQSGQQGTLNNACFIDVDTEINIKYLNLAANSSIECDYIIINNTTLRASSILRSRVFGAQNAQWNFVGDATTGRALISSETVEYIHNGGVTINGPIYFETNSYSEKGLNQSGINEYKKAIETAYNNNAVTGAGCGVVGSAPFLIIPDGFYDDTDISKADCVGHGNIPAEFANIVDKNIQWVVAFEDLGSTGDYDFNDAVVGLVHRKSENKLIITPLAAGGTLPATLYYDNTELGEIHSLLGGSNTNTPINVDHRGDEGTQKEISVDEDFSITENWNKLKIKVKDQASEFILQPSREKGAVPQAICMPAPWFWAKEGIDIKDAYIQFEGWSQDSGSNLKWHQNPTREKVALQ